MSEIVSLTATDARALTDRIKVGFAAMASAPLPSHEEANRDDRSVYFIIAWRSRMVKIGVAADPKRRLREIQSMSPERLELIAATQVGGQALERKLHGLLGPLREHGEWFSLTGELMEILMEISK